MTASAAIKDTPVLRAADGTPPLGAGGKFFRDDQGEVFEYRSPNVKIIVLELDNGNWLAKPPGLGIDEEQYETRAEALEVAVDNMMMLARLYMAAKEGEGVCWTEEFGNGVIRWANGLRPEKEITPKSDAWMHAGDDAEQLTRDPVVNHLLDLHSKRRQFPAQHTFSMTNPIEDGTILMLATCKCGHVIKFGAGDQLRVDAAIEAHWQRHPHGPMVDGRGQPIIPGDGNRIPKAAKSRKRKSSDGLNDPRDDSLISGPHRPNGRGETSDPSETNIADAVPPAPRSEPATFPQSDAGSPLSASEEGAVLAPASEPAPAVPSLSAGAGEIEHAPIGAGETVPSRGNMGLGLSAALRTSAGCLPSQASNVGGRDVTAGETAPISDDDDLDLAWPNYQDFLEDKIVVAPMRGIEVARDALHPYLKPHCKDLTVWALRLGCAAIFASFGLHKTAMQLEWCRQLHRHTGSPTLCVVPLGVRHGFIKEALNLAMDVRFIRTDAEYHALYAEGVRHFLTNYESIRDGKLDPNLFTAVSLDEASVLRSYGSKTFQEFLPLFSKVTFKLVSTATPSPNRYKELIHYSGFLGVMDTGLALTRWFQRNSEKAGDLTLYPHKADEFWMWIHSFCAFLQKPSELGYSDDGYELPPLKIRWHEVPADHSKAEPERDGQSVMFRDVATSLQQSAKSRRDSLPARVAKMMEIIAQDPESHRIIWHDLEAEREAIEAALPSVVTISGSMDIDAREVLLHDFEEGRIKYFGTKPILSGSGSNFQYHCHKAVYVGMPGDGYKFNDFIQSLYRLQRFGQQHPVEIDIIYSEDMRAGKAALETKWALDIEMRQRMSEIIKRHGLNTLPLRDALLRSIGVQRVEIASDTIRDGVPLWRAINNDAVAEFKTWPENSVDLIVSSIPFGKQYEYSASYRDFGHSDDNAHFWSQMDFLSSELLRTLKPGRLACIHVKDRILFGAVTGEGVPTVEPFHAEAIMHYRAHGFQYMGMITVVTDVVRENNQTYRLGWSENAKDSTKMGCGMPEYILLLRKPQSDRTRSYADVPVTKVKGYSEEDFIWRFILERDDAGQIVRDEDGEPHYIDMGRGQGSEPDPNDRSPPELLQPERPDRNVEGYSRARWQVDAHSLWRSSGNRLLSTAEFAEFESADMARHFSKMSVDRIYDHEAHVKIGEVLERKGTLPATFMAIAPGSHHPDVWTDIHRMRTLNMLQQRKGAEMHLCPLQWDIVDRLIERYSNEGELVVDPFGGLMTVPYRALLKGRKGAATELSATYFMDGVHYLRAAEEKIAMPALFDLKAFDQLNADVPPPLDGDVMGGERSMSADVLILPVVRVERGEGDWSHVVQCRLSSTEWSRQFKFAHDWNVTVQEAIKGRGK
jgi:hypothetical protein